LPLSSTLLLITLQDAPIQDILGINGLLDFQGEWIPDLTDHSLEEFSPPDAFRALQESP